MFRVKDSYKYNMHKMELLKAVNFLKYLGSIKKGLNKISFIYNYKIVYTKKLLGHLWL